MSLILDPSEIAQPGRVELDLLSDTIYAKPEGIDWGDTALENYKAQQTYGEAIVDWRLPNRVVTIPLIVRGRPEGESMIEAMGRLQAKVARLATEGGALKRVRGGLTMYADIETAHLVLPDTWTGENRDFEAEGQLVLECRPDFYGAEKTEDAVVGASGLVVFVLSDVDGNYPARCEITATDNDSTRIRGLIYGFRSRHYSAQETAALMYTVDTLENTAAHGTIITDADSTSGDALEAGIPAAWEGVVRCLESGVNPLTHVGAFRVWLRVKRDSSISAQIPTYFRLAYAQNDLSQWSYLPPSEPFTASDGEYHLVNLGVVRLPPTHLGGDRWVGVVQAKMGALTGTIALDRIEFQPVDESHGILRPGPPVESPVRRETVYDNFAGHSSGNLTGKTIGGYTWTLLPGSSNSTDFAINTDLDYVQRTTTNGSSRRVYLPVALTDMTVTSMLFHNGTYPFKQGVMARASDSSNLIEGYKINNGPSAPVEYGLRVRVGGTYILDETVPYWRYASFTEMRLEVVGDRATLYVAPEGATTWENFIEVTDGRIATMPAGGGGIYDEDANVSSWRGYDSFLIEEIEYNERAVISADRSALLTTHGCFTETDDGGYWGRIVPYGGYPRLPVAAEEGRTTEIFVRVSVGDMLVSDDSVLLSPSVEVKYRPCWSSVPEEISAGGSGSGSGSGS